MAFARWERPVQNAAGDLIENVWCEVRDADADGNPLAELFSDRDGAVPLSNPFQTLTGAPAFHVAGGCYNIRVYGSGFDKTFTYVGVGTSSEHDVEAGTGDVTGPDDSINENPAVFDGLTGKVLKELSYTQFLAKLAAFTADAGGNPGLKGLVPAPASGDAAAGKVLGVNGWTAQGAMSLNTQSGAYTLLAADRGKLVRFTGGSNVTWGFTAAATLGAGWFCYLVNDSATHYPTLDPNSSEQIDAKTSYPMLPGEMRLVLCTGSGFISWVIKPFNFTITATLSGVTVPPGYSAFDVEAWGGGGSGGSRSSTGSSQIAGGGAGGGHGPRRRIKASLLGTTFTATIGTGGASVTGNSQGNNGADTSFASGSLSMSVAGGQGGNNGTTSAGGRVGALGGWSDETIYQATTLGAGGTAGGNPGSGGNAHDGGGGTAGADNSTIGAKGGDSVNGGAGGGGLQANPPSTSAPGVSVFGGNGGAAANSGSATAGGPRGGGGGGVRGGGNSGAGGRGELIMAGVV